MGKKLCNCCIFLLLFNQLLIFAFTRQIFINNMKQDFFFTWHLVSKQGNIINEANFTSNVENLTTKKIQNAYIRTEYLWVSMKNNYLLFCTSNFHESDTYKNVLLTLMQSHESCQYLPRCKKTESTVVTVKDMAHTQFQYIDLTALILLYLTSRQHCYIFLDVRDVNDIQCHLQLST